MKGNFVYLNQIIEELSEKYDVDLRNTPIQDVKDLVSHKDWIVLHDVIKYGKTTRRLH
jgi:hypothetical protein|tara:strand:- start:2050 stop:2223 length:174 start_codon:yes stop_codon:yes gene_type:complete